LAEGRTEGSAHMSEGSNGYQDSRPGAEPTDHPGPDGPEGAPLAWYQRGMELLSRGSPAAAAQILQRAATVEPGSRSVREALARAQRPDAVRRRRPGPIRRLPAQPRGRDGDGRGHRGDVGRI